MDAWGRFRNVHALLSRSKMQGQEGNAREGRHGGAWGIFRKMQGEELGSYQGTSEGRER